MLDLHAPGLDEINVFPVADHDTGRNMAAVMSRVADATAGRTTFASLADAVRGVPPGTDDGHSGHMLGRFLAVFSGSLVNVDRVDADALAFALEDAATALEEGIVEPRAGTMVSVAACVAQAALDAIDRGGDLAEVAAAVADAAVEDLERTPEHLEVLADHGVVDAGAAGLCVVIEALAAAMGGGADDAPRDVADHRRGAVAWDVRFAIDTDEDGSARLSALLESLGDEVAVEGGPSTWACRIRCTDIGAAIDAALTVGRPRGFDVDAVIGSP